jgi:hypothetical protein
MENQKADKRAEANQTASDSYLEIPSSNLGLETGYPD